MCKAAHFAIMLLSVTTSAAAAEPARTQSELPSERSAGKLETVATLDGDMPTGITVSDDDRIFICIPRWQSGIETTVAELDEGTLTAFPSPRMQQYASMSDSDRFISVQSVVIGPAGKLWALDTGRPLFKEAERGGPKLLAIDLTSGKVTKRIVFEQDVALPTTYLNDVRFDLSRGTKGMAFITDSSSAGPNAIIVVDLASGDAWRKLENHPSVRPEEDFLPFVEGRPLLQHPEDGDPAPIKTGSDGLALSHDGERLFYSPLAGRRLYSVSVDALEDKSLSDQRTAATIVDYSDRGFASDGLESDAEGFVYLTNYEDNAVVRWQPGRRHHTLVHHPTMLWPDTLEVASNGYLYMTCNQLHRQPRFQAGEDLREKPYVIFRTKIDNAPVRLK